MAKIETRGFDSARDFLAALHRSNSDWLSPGMFEVPWIFRGVKDADWEWNLVPSAWRPRFRTDFKFMFDHWEKRLNEEELESAFQGLTTDRQTPEHRAALRTAWLQNAIEATLVEAFCHLTEELRFRLPGGELPVFRRKLHYFEYGTHNQKMHPAFGLAQHHRIPTRLLDWTRSPKIAAFFAAEMAKPTDGGRIAVFALNTEKTEFQRNPFQVFEVPRSDIDYLYAQQGLFTFFENADRSFVYDLRWRRFEDSIKDGGLQKLTLPHSEVPELIRLLWGEGISRAHLMPTLDNVAVALRNMWSHYADGWFSTISGAV